MNSSAKPKSITERIAPITPEIIKTKIVSLIASFLVGHVTFLSYDHIKPADFDAEGLVLLCVTLLLEDIINFLYAKFFFCKQVFYKILPIQFYR